MRRTPRQIVSLTFAVVGCLCLAATLVQAQCNPGRFRGGGFACGMAASYPTVPPMCGGSPYQWQPSVCTSFAGAFATSSPFGPTAGASAFAGGGPCGGSVGAGVFAGSGPFGAQAGAFTTSAGPCLADPWRRPGRIEIIVRSRPPRCHGSWPRVPGD